MRGESSVPAVCGPSRVGADDSEVIRGTCIQARDVRADVLVIVAGLGLIGCSRSIGGGPSILEVHSGVQTVRIDASVQLR